MKKIQVNRNEFHESNLNRSRQIGRMFLRNRRYEAEAENPFFNRLVKKNFLRETSPAIRVKNVILPGLRVGKLNVFHIIYQILQSR